MYTSKNMVGVINGWVDSILKRIPGDVTMVCDSCAAQINLNQLIAADETPSYHIISNTSAG